MDVITYNGLRAAANDESLSYGEVDWGEPDEEGFYTPTVVQA